MTTGSFPIDQNKRRAILVLQQHDMERCSYEPGAGQALIDDEVFVLQLPVCVNREVPPALQSIIDADLARPGNMLLLSPYDVNSYVDASLASGHFALEKYMHFSNLCRHLGAKEVTVKQIELRTGSSKSTINIKGGRPGVSAQFTTENEDLEKFCKMINLHDEFSGGPPNIDQAESFLRQKKLWADPTMRTLVEMRRDGANQLITRELVLNLSSETKRSLNVVGRLKVPNFVNLSADYGRVVNEQNDYTLTLLVRF